MSRSGGDSGSSTSAMGTLFLFLSGPMPMRIGGVGAYSRQPIAISTPHVGSREAAYTSTPMRGGRPFFRRHLCAFCRRSLFAICRCPLSGDEVATPRKRSPSPSLTTSSGRSRPSTAADPRSCSHVLSGVCGGVAMRVCAGEYRMRFMGVWPSLSLGSAARNSPSSSEGSSIASKGHRVGHRCRDHTTQVITHAV